ncbi:MAG TPA: terminase small subunit [Chitinivibrionales bacterium]|nr:terminase small subunit [Chitinivibrionales bacterium]
MENKSSVSPANSPDIAENPDKIIVLSPKRERFCQEFIKNHNAKEAAENAGYSRKTSRVQGPRLLLNADVKARIAQLEKPIAEKLQIDTEWVVRRSKEVAERCMQAVPVMIKEGDKLVESGEYEFDSRGANGALALLAKHVGGFDDSIKIKIPSQEKGKYTDRQKAAMADALDALDAANDKNINPNNN